MDNILNRLFMLMASAIFSTQKVSAFLRFKEDFYAD